MKMPNLSACAASPEAYTQTPIEQATDTSDAVKNKFDSDSELSFMFSPILVNKFN
jgi:hypothetical protein